MNAKTKALKRKGDWTAEGVMEHEFGQWKKHSRSRLKRGLKAEEPKGGDISEKHAK